METLCHKVQPTFVLDIFFGWPLQHISHRSYTLDIHHVPNLFPFSVTTNTYS